MHWQTSRFQIDLTRPRVMGIVNLTPDSFSDGGRLMEEGAALARCERLVAEGADILDIGGESTRPGARPVPADEELARLLPVLRGAVRLGVPVSVDTSKPEVIRQVLAEGADIINDVRSLRLPDAAEAVAAHARCGVCLMHMQGEPQSMVQQPLQGDAPPQVRDFLQQATQRLVALGVSADRLVWDPGIGFGKTLEQNFALLARQRELLADGHPLLVGWSRKGSLGKVTGLPVGERLVPSVAAALLAVERGAHIVRVHDVAPTVAALKLRFATIAADISHMSGEKAA